jgi:hypothetical protein
VSGNWSSFGLALGGASCGHGEKTDNMPLNDAKMQRLKRLEARLQECVRSGKVELAIEITADIRGIFCDNLGNHRLLKAKLWCFEAALVGNRVDYATQGMEGVRGRAKRGTKLYLEATVLLAVCYLRNKRLADAKPLIHYVLSRLNDIQSDTARQLFQRKFIDRIEQECVLSELIGIHEGVVTEESIHSRMVLLLKNSSDDQIFGLIGGALPANAILALTNVNTYALQQIRPSDQKALPAPRESQQPPALGKKTLAVFQRIAWRTFCDPESEIFKLWSKGLPGLSNHKIMAGAVAATLTGWNIGLPVLGAGLAAALIKFTADHFCDVCKPEVFMTTRKEVNSSREQKRTANGP